MPPLTVWPFVENARAYLITGSAFVRCLSAIRNALHFLGM